MIGADASSLGATAASNLESAVSLTVTMSTIPLMSMSATTGTTMATSGMPSNSANGTGAPTSPSSAPTPSSSNGAGTNGVVVGAGALAVGLSGLMALL